MSENVIVENTEAVVPPPVRPSITFESITFSSGTKLEFDQDEIVVFVGPNNAGKSATLRELESYVSSKNAGNVVKGATFRRVGQQHDLLKNLEKHSQKVGGGNGYSFAGIGYNIHNSHVRYFGDPPNESLVAPYFCTRLATETRITASNAAGHISLHIEAPSHPIHVLLADNKIAEEISALFRKAFGQDLIVFRAGGSRFPLYVGTRPKLSAGEDELSKSYVDRLQAGAALLEEQGDGMRSFVTVLLYALATEHHTIQLLDEPEAFLHPPQARLIGEYIARERKSKSQLFIATHSTDLLDGLISGGSNKIRVIRIQREHSVNRVKELSKEKAAAIAHDTLTRYSGVFNGIFFQHVIICESDADCLFYNSILSTKEITGNRRADVLFIHAAGKHRMAKLADTLKQLDVPVSVIADIDILNEEVALQKLFETLGGDWLTIKAKWKSMKTAIESRNSPSNFSQVVQLIKDQLKIEKGSGTKPFPKEAERAIKSIFKAQTPWAYLKGSGRAAIPKGQAIKDYDFLADKCSDVGLWIVPVGELEGFCRSVDGGHGPGFVSKVLEEKNLETDAELEEARNFVKSIWKRSSND